jgi:HsdM-like protein
LYDELDYTEQTSWLLFLKYLDGLEQDRATESALEGKKYTFILDEPYRWRSREASPSAAVLDSQSVKSAEKGAVKTARWVMTPARR